MTGWSHGYNVSTGYTYGFYRETAPDWIDYALALRGLEPPRRQGGAPFRYLELGSGQGFGLCLLAAANPEGEFLGIDFSPEHTAHARALAADLKLTNVQFLEGDFAELGTAWPSEHGAFDYVVMHGIYSWVPQAIRRSIVAILAAATNPGAAVYVSFNTQPGWVSTLPLQHILSLIDQESPARGMAAIQAGRDLFTKMEAAGSGVTRALPALKARLETIRNKPEAYLVQEYLHENWHPMWCSEVMKELAGAKLALGASATIAENLLPHVLPQAFQEVLAGREEPRLREDLIDCLINQSFRRDLYVRGVRRRNPGDRKWIGQYRFWRTNPADLPEEISVPTGFGTVALKAAEVAPLMEAIGDGSRSLAELAALPAARKDPQLLRQTLVFLIHAGWLNCARREPVAASAAAVNAAVAAVAAEGGPYRHLAAPVLGSAIPATDAELMMLDLHGRDRAGFEKAGGKLLAQSLARLGRKLGKDGKPLEGEAEAAEMARISEQFRTRTLPAWRRLGVTD